METKHIMQRIHMLRRVGRGVATVLGLTMLASCTTDEILSVEDIDVARPGALTGASALPTVYAAVLTDFQLAYAGGNSEGHVNLTGVITDELLYSETFPTRVQWDRRSIEPVNGSTEGIFRQLLRAHATTELAARRFAEFGLASSATDNARRAEIYNVWGMIYLLAAEAWCSGVPFSKITDTGELQFGSPQTTAQIFALAISKLDSASTFAAAAGTAGATQLNVAAILKGRTLMNQGQYAAAATAVAAVPVATRYDVLHSANSTRQWNGLWSLIVNGRRWVVANNKGGTGAPFASSNDPRIRPTRLGTQVGFDGATPLIVPNSLVADRTMPTNVARGVEAQLILAEVAARNNDANYLTILNTLRANTALYACPTQLAGCVAPTALAPLTIATGVTARIDQVIRERGFWLYGTAHRLGDFRRLIRNDNRTQESVFPSGAYPLGGTYGTDVNFPIPQPDEAGNQNVKNDPVNGLCLDRKA
jgi:starch-binding outer membrane protein, SusD/RagB family